MGYAKAEVSGHVMATYKGQSKTGKPSFTIVLSTGKSEKLKDGSWDNSKQVIWRLTAWGDYAEKLEFEQIVKGDKVRAEVIEPRPRIFNGKNGTSLYIEGPLFNHTLSRVIWVPKDAKAADNYVPHDDDAAAPGAEDWDPAQYESQMQ